MRHTGPIVPIILQSNFWEIPKFFRRPGYPRRVRP